MKKCLNKGCSYFNKEYENNCRAFIKPEICETNITSKPKPKSYDFIVNNPRLIDNDEIFASLSRKKPLLFLEQNKTIRVFIHKSIQTKASILGLYVFQPEILPLIFSTNQKHLKAAWIKWVKLVKVTEWKEDKDVQKVKFTFPKI